MRGMSKNEKHAWETLQGALQRSNPACGMDGRFVEDEPSEASLKAMAGICDSCPIFDACNGYAPFAKAGFWAGRLRSATIPKRTAA